MDEEMVIFIRTFDLLEWLLPKSERFPRAYRSAVADGCGSRPARRRSSPPRRGRVAGGYRRCATPNAALGRLRIYLRLAHRWRWLSEGQYEHVGGMVGEIGRLLGG